MFSFDPLHLDEARLEVVAIRGEIAKKQETKTEGREEEEEMTTRSDSHCYWISRFSFARMAVGPERPMSRRPRICFRNCWMFQRGSNLCFISTDRSLSAFGNLLSQMEAERFIELHEQPYPYGPRIGEGKAAAHLLASVKCLRAVQQKAAFIAKELRQGGGG